MGKMSLFFGGDSSSLVVYDLGRYHLGLWD